MDESWLEEVEVLKEQDWEFPEEPIEDPFILLEAFNSFHSTVRRRLGQAQDDLKILKETYQRHRADFNLMDASRRDRKYEERVLSKDLEAIDAKEKEIRSMEKDQADMNDRIFRLETEIAELEKKKKEAAQKRSKSGAQDEPKAKRAKDISPGRAGKILQMAEKLKDVRTMAALRTLIDECAVLAQDEEQASTGEHSEEPPMVPSPDLDLPDDDDVAGLSMLEAIATYSADEKERLLTRK